MIEEINSLKFEMNQLMSEQTKNPFGGEILQTEEDLDSQRSYHQQQHAHQSESYRKSRLHTFSQMFIDKSQTGLKQVQSILDESLNSNHLLLFQDSRGEIWQISKRDDLNTDDLLTMQSTL